MSRTEVFRGYPRVPTEVSTCHRTPRRRLRFATAALVVVGLAGAVSCGGGSEGAAPVVTPGGSNNPIAADAAEATGAFLASRVGMGISEAGGRIRTPATPCPAPGTPGAPAPIPIALTTPDVFNLDVVGLGNLVYDDPGHIIDAYINKVNSFGGIAGHCFEFRKHVYGFTDPVGDFGRICSDTMQEQPLVLLALGLNDAILGCATLGAGVPTLGLYAQFPRTTFDTAGGLLRVDHGGYEFLLDNALDSALRSGELTTGDFVGLLSQEGDNAATLQATFEGAARRLGLSMTTSVAVPPQYSGTAMLVAEELFRQAGGEVMDPDAAAFGQALSAVPEDIGNLMGAIRQHFLGLAASLRDLGVTAVVAGGPWSDVRFLMRAAELANWQPKWLLNDRQYTMLVLTDAPRAQGLNLLQVSSRRAADDPIDGLDRGCLSLRNTDTDAEPFSHRFHTDAWSLMTSTCDYLDVIFGAVSRVNGPLTRESFAAALSETSYAAAHGQRIRFSAEDYYGSDSFRVLRADPDCILNTWGCMRPLSEWYEPAGTQAAGEGEG